jgi:exopolysaccharide biosynthesis polyprenyl glycosylphosphotransferase
MCAASGGPTMVAAAYLRNGRMPTSMDVTPPAAVAPKSSMDWRSTYARRLALTDAIAIIWVVIAVQLLRFGLAADPSIVAEDMASIDLSYWTISVVIIAAWIAILGVYKTHDYRFVGTGTLEYKRVADASIRLFGLVAITAFLFKVDLARGYVLLAFPAGIAVLLFTRWLWRQWLSVQRSKGRFTSRLILVGTYVSNEAIRTELQRVRDAGYDVVAMWVPEVPPNATTLSGVMVFGAETPVLQAMMTSGADTVAITNSDVLGTDGVRSLSWSLEPGHQHLILAPTLTDVSGPRVHMRPVAGLPLIHVETPRYEGAKQFTKRGFDILASGIAIAILSFPMLVLGMLVRLSSEGPALFRQQRVGKNGQLFTMLKYRSMVTDAEDRLQALIDHERTAGNSVLFKLREDPRVTPIGKFMRRFSLDELPQLFNIFLGHMSVVGPRPPLAKEVEEYEDHVHRRFLVKPGLTGLWQVSGRSDLSWEDSVRLDLYYVENWSLAGDFVLVWRTLKAVLRREGAY